MYPINHLIGVTAVCYIGFEYFYHGTYCLIVNVQNGQLLNKYREQSTEHSVLCT